MRGEMTQKDLIRAECLNYYFIRVLTWYVESEEEGLTSFYVPRNAVNISLTEKSITAPLPGSLYFSSPTLFLCVSLLRLSFCLALALFQQGADTRWEGGARKQPGRTDRA